MNHQQLIVFLLFAMCASTESQNVECNTNATHFDVLPGFGWDNLRNVEASRVVTFNYSECQLTADGKYLLPHGVSILPLKQTKLDQYSELFDTFTDYTSVTAETINKDPGFRIQGWKISGRFSDGFLKSKRLQVDEKSTVTRAQLKFMKYRVKLQPDTQLSNAFKIAILNIARHVLYERYQMARYESEMLVRDFGTHVITSVDTGAAIVQEDHLRGNGATRENVVLGASMSLQEATGIGLNYDTNSSSMKAILDEYKSNRLQSYVKTYGGPPFMSSDWSRSWTSNLDDNLVAIDRTGEPIYNFINIKTLPTVPASILYDVTTYIKNAVRDYYGYNTFPGCTDVNSTRFNSIVNVDDGSCNVDLNDDGAFGGTFQSCRNKSDKAGNVCSHLVQKNLQTNSETCPDNFDRTEIYTWHFETTSSKRVCKTCYGFFNCCDDEPVKSSADLKSYICTKTNSKSKLGTFSFGGFYSSISDNPLTKGQSCPENFQAKKIGDDISMCVNNSQDAKTNVSFGGLYSCSYGNPLAGSSPAAKSCPKGFSALLAGVINDCPVYYCVLLSDLPSDISEMVKRPPFTARMKIYPGESGEQVVYDPETQQWLSELESRELKESEAFVELTSGEAAVIAIFVTVAFILLLALAFYCYRKRKNQYPMGRGNNSNSTTRNSTTRQEDAV